MTQPMRNIDILETILKSLMRKDIDSIAQYIHEDFKVEEAAGLPYGGVRWDLEGRTGYGDLQDVLWSDYVYEMSK